LIIVEIEKQRLNIAYKGPGLNENNYETNLIKVHDMCQLLVTRLEKAAAGALGCEPEELREEKYDNYGLRVFSAYGLEYAVGTDEEAQEACKQYILDSVWTFRSEFIASHTKAGASNGMIKAIKALQEACEDSNEDVKSLIEDMDEFIEDAISSDGRGTFLSSYDSDEVEVVVDGEYFYAYRLN